MRAMILDKPGTPLRLADVPVPKPEPHQLLILVKSCGVCRTDLHVVDGDLPDPALPLIPGHQIVGTIAAIGSEVKLELAEGDRVGVPWLGGSCGQCQYCLSGRENLCDSAMYTGYQLNGGFAEYCVADARFCFPIPDTFDDIQTAPLLCAGLIGYRSYRMAGPGKRLGLYGFGAAAHIVIQLARFEGRDVYAFTRPGDTDAQDLALQLGAVWVGGSDELPPDPLDVAIIFAPLGELVPQALKAVGKGGVVVCAGIHMTDIPSFPYSLLWGERMVRSVANLTRRDGENFLQLAPRIPIKTQVTTYKLEEANQALDDLRHGRFTGAAVIVP